MKRLALILCLAGLLGMTLGCNPRLDWREVHSSRVPFAVAFPAKPIEQTRDTALAGQKLPMTMHTAQVDGVMYSAASIGFPDADAARAAIPLLQQTLVGNLGGKLLESKPLQTKQGDGLQFRAAGTQHGTQALIMQVRLLQHKQTVFQLVVFGPPKKISEDALDTFFTSFKLE